MMITRVLSYLLVSLALLGTSSISLNGCVDLESDRDDPCANGACELDCEPGYEERSGECVVNVNLDEDQDGVPDEVDNCRTIANADQADCDGDGLGDVCDEEIDCGISMSGYISLYDPELGEDRALINSLIEVEGHPLYTLTDVGGQYSIPHLEPGDYHLLVFAPPEEALTDRPLILARLPFSIENLPSGEEVVKDFTINPPGDLIGSVSFADQPQFEAAHGGIGVYVEHIPFITAVTDSRGYFELRGVPAGVQTLKFVYPDYQGQSVPVEILSLSSIEIGRMGELQLINSETSAEWDHALKIKITDLDPLTMININVELTPTFPHLSDPVIISLSGESDSDGALLVSERVSHLQHDIFNLTVGENLRLANLYQLDQPINRTLRETTLFTNSLPATWINFSDRREDIAATSTADIPNRPQQVVNEDYNSIPYGTTNAEGDTWTILRIDDQTMQKEELEDIQIKLAPLRYPIAHKFGQLALAKTHSLLLLTPEGTPEMDTTYQMRFRYETSSWNRQLKVMATPYPCPISSKADPGILSIAGETLLEGCGTADIYQARCQEIRQQWNKCELQEIEVDLNSCDISRAGQYDCTIDLKLSSRHAEMRLWITDNISSDELLITHEGCDLQCLNPFSARLAERPTHIPLYSLIHRDLIQRDSCSEYTLPPPFQHINTSLNTDGAALPDSCFPRLPFTDFGDSLGSCVSQPVRSASGRYFILTGAEFSTDGGGIVNDIFTNQLNVNTYMDLNELNPIAVYLAGVSCLDEYCNFPLQIRYRVSDGISDINRENALRISQLSRGDNPYQGEQPYCWSFE